MPGVKVPKFLARAFGARELEPGLGRDACQKRVNSFLVRCFAAFGLHVRFPILRTYLRIDVRLEVPNENVSTNVPNFFARAFGARELGSIMIGIRSENVPFFDALFAFWI